MSPLGTPAYRTVVSLAESALRRGHEIIIFGTGDGVESMKNDIVGPSMLQLTKLRGGGRLLVCRESARRRGLSAEAGLIEGVKMSSLAEMVELLYSCDRTLIFG